MMVNKETQNPKVDAFIARSPRWGAELSALRSLAIQSGFGETMKWGKPCYTYESRNLLVLAPFKQYCGIIFFKGALLKDPDKLLVKPGEATHAGRQMRFDSVAQITKNKAAIKRFFAEAIAAEKAGLKVDPATKPVQKVPMELTDQFKSRPDFKAAFKSLTPGRQRAYLLHFCGAKQSKTITARIEKWLPNILTGKGMND